MVLASSAPESVCTLIAEELGAALTNLDVRVRGIGVAPKATGAASLPFASRLTGL